MTNKPSGLPATMTAALATAYGSPEVIAIKQVSLPTQRPGGMLVKVHASAVNSGDARSRALDIGQPMKTLMRLVLGFTKPRQPILGTVFAGTVVSAARESGFVSGDKVFGASPGLSMGCHAQYVALPAGAPVARMPKDSSFEDLASLAFGGATALFFLERAGASPGKHALIYGAAGAVGSKAVQLAKAMGMQVTAVASKSNHQLLTDLGADTVLDYTAPGFALPKQAYDLVFDAVGELKKSKARDAIKPGGAYATVGGATVTKETATHMQQLATWFHEGKLKPVINQQFAFADIRKAHALVDSGHKWGSAVLILP